jgi:cobalt-zinc-cadmium resistance protein CzcA
LQHFQLQEDYLNQEAELIQRTAKRPDVQVGYFLQSLEKNFAFQGVSLGVGIPLDRRQAKVKSEQLTLQQQQLAVQKQAWQQQRAQRLLFLQKNMAQLRQAIEDFEQQILPRQANIQRIAQLQLQYGEIDFLAFNQIQRQLLEQQNQYLNNIKNYNEQVTELVFLAKK